MKTYKVMGNTNPWIAARDITFNGKTEVVFERGISLREAQKKLLEFFNSDYGTYFQNWGLVRCNYPYESSSFNDGIRSYSYDSRIYYIEEDNEEKWYCSSYNCIDADGNVSDDVSADNDFFIAENDDAAISHAKELANNGVDYVDEGHFDLELVSVTRVDPNREWEDIETIWY